MKKLLIICLTVTLFSCSKDQDVLLNEPQQTSSSIEYKVNGSLVVMENVDAASLQYVTFFKQLKGLVPNTRYVLNAQQGANHVLALAITTDSLQLASYHYTNTDVSIFTLQFNGQPASLYSGVDYFDVNITSYSGGKISGTFTAKTTPLTLNGFGVPGSIVITEGEINNVQVIY